MDDLFFVMLELRCDCLAFHWAHMSSLMHVNISIIKNFGAITDRDKIDYQVLQSNTTNFNLFHFTVIAKINK